MLDTDNCLLISLAITPACCRQVRQWRDALRREGKWQGENMVLQLTWRRDAMWTTKRPTAWRSNMNWIRLRFSCDGNIYTQFRRASLLVSRSQKKKTPQSFRYEQGLSVYQINLSQCSSQTKSCANAELSNQDKLCCSQHRRSEFSGLKKKQKNKLSAFYINIYSNG